MSGQALIRAFVADWFSRFDRLDPPSHFLPNLAQDVHWNAPDSDLALHGHERFLAWYEDVLATFERPTEHDIINIVEADGAVSFDVQLRAITQAGERVVVNAHESWRYEIEASGTPIITHYDVSINS